MAEKPQKLKFPKCEGYGVETLDYGNVSDTHYISFSDQAEKALSKAEQEGAKATLEKIERMIQGTSTINALEGGVVALECYYINADAFNRLKAELEGKK